MTNLDETEPSPEGELTLSARAEPAADKPSSGVTAGWIISQMERAALKSAASAIGSSAVTVALDGLHFVSPVKRGAPVNFYTMIKGAGRTSIKVYVEVWAQSSPDALAKVTGATFVLVAVDQSGRARPINQH